MTLTLTGAGFDRTTIVELLDSGGATYPADAVSIDTPTHLTATFAAGSVPPGTYTVRARRPTGGEAVLANAFRVVAGGHPQLETKLVVPEFVLPERPDDILRRVRQHRRRGHARPAPGPALHDQAILTLDAHRLVQGTQTSASPDGFSDTVQIYASGATAWPAPAGRADQRPGLLRRVAAPLDLNDHLVHTAVSVFTSDDPTPIDWASLQARCARPASRPRPGRRSSPTSPPRSAPPGATSWPCSATTPSTSAASDRRSRT